jgi:transposase
MRRCNISKAVIRSAAAFSGRRPTSAGLDNRCTDSGASDAASTFRQRPPLVLPTVTTAAMQVFLDHVAASRPPDAHLVMVLDGAGWHVSRDLVVPPNITLVVQPPYSPELNPVERVWLYLRKRFLSLRLLHSTETIINACCDAWLRVVAETGRIKSLCSYPWIEKVAS